MIVVHYAETRENKSPTMTAIAPSRKGVFRFCMRWKSRQVVGELVKLNDLKLSSDFQSLGQNKDTSGAHQ